MPSHRDTIVRWLVSGAGDVGRGAELAPKRAPARAALLATLALSGQAAAAGLGDAHDLIAFCRPPAAATRVAEGPCVCSAEGVEQPLTPVQFLGHVRERRSAGAMSAAELRAAVRHVSAACGGEGAAAAPAGSP